MATLECDHETVAGVTLVTCRLTSDAPRRVTVEPIHDDPVWPPRRQGVPEQGWHDDGWTGIVAADGVRALGYATPAEPEGDPVHITATEPPPDDGSVTARDVVRALGDPTPTRDAVEPVDATDRAEPDDGDTRTTEPSTSVELADPSGQATGSGGDAARESRSDTSPPATDLDAIETRLWTARDLADVSTVAEASDAVERAGGIQAVRDLAAQLAEDRAHLATVEERAARLAAEAEAVSVPVDSLERVV